MSEKKVKVRAHERVREGQYEHVREHRRTIDGRAGNSSLSEKPPEEDGYDITATVEAESDSKGNLRNTEVSEVTIKPKKENKA